MNKKHFQNEARSLVKATMIGKITKIVQNSENFQRLFRTFSVAKGAFDNPKMASL